MHRSETNNSMYNLLGFPDWTPSEIMRTEPRAIWAFLVEVSIAVSVFACLSLVGTGLDLWNTMPAFSETMQNCVESDPPTFGCGLVGVIGLAMAVALYSLKWLVAWAVSVVGWLTSRCVRIPLIIVGVILGCCHGLILSKGNGGIPNLPPRAVQFGFIVGIFIILSGYAALYLSHRPIR